MSERQTRLSVVIPTYDRQALCERALRSALAQDVDGMEVIVVDDCSPSPFMLPADCASDPRIRVLRHDVNRGAGQARDTGVAASRAEWIAFLDSDDYWLPGTLAQRLDRAERAFAASADPLVAYAAGFVLERKSSGRREPRIPVASDGRPLGVRAAQRVAVACRALGGASGACLVGAPDVDIVEPRR